MTVVRVNGGRVMLWCPACDDLHVISTSPNGWTFDGNTERPTISPSIKVGGVQWPDEYPEMQKPRHHVEPGQPIVCHSFVRDGQWEFLGDCTHDLAGQTVQCVPIPDDLFKYASA